MPVDGREIDKRRPAIVLSALNYNLKSGMCVVVPTTTQLGRSPFWIQAPDGLLNGPSMILCDYVRSVDYRERSIEFVKKVSREVMDDITGRLLDLIDPVYK